MGLCTRSFDVDFYYEENVMRIYSEGEFICKVDVGEDKLSPSFEREVVIDGVPHIMVQIYGSIFNVRIIDFYTINENGSKGENCPYCVYVNKIYE